jgi:hypothetical protein
LEEEKKKRLDAEQREQSLQQQLEDAQERLKEKEGLSVTFQ